MLTEDMSRILPGKNGASTIPRHIRVANKSPNVFVAACAAEMMPQMDMTVPRKILGRARVSSKFEGI